MKLITLLLIAFTVQSFSQDTTTSTPLQFMFGATAGLNYEMYGGVASNELNSPRCPIFVFDSPSSYNYSPGYEIGGVCKIGFSTSDKFSFGLRLAYQQSGQVKVEFNEIIACIPVYDIKGDSIIDPNTYWFNQPQLPLISNRLLFTYTSHRILFEPSVSLPIVSGLRLSVAPSCTYSFSRSHKQTYEIFTPGYEIPVSSGLSISNNGRLATVVDNSGSDLSMSGIVRFGVSGSLSKDISLESIIISPNVRFTYLFSDVCLDGITRYSASLSKLFVGCDVLLP